DGGKYLIIIFEHGLHEYTNIGKSLFDYPDRFNPRHSRHVDIHHHNVGNSMLHILDQFVRVGKAPGTDHALCAVDELNQAVAKFLVILKYGYPYCHRNYFLYVILNLSSTHVPSLMRD